MAGVYILTLQESFAARIGIHLQALQRRKALRLYGNYKRDFELEN